MFIGDSPWGCKVHSGSCVESVRVSVAGRGPFPRPLRVGFCLTLGNELSKETPILTRQKILLRSGIRAESSRVRETRRTALSCGLQSFMAMGLVSGFSLANHLAWPVFGMTQCPSWWYVRLSAKMNFSKKDYGSLVEYGLTSPSFRPLLNSPS